MKTTVTVRLEPDEAEQIKKLAYEGNVSQWVRLLVKRELDRLNQQQNK